MEAMKPALDVLIDANVVLLVAFGLWACIQFALTKSRWRYDYVLQLRLLRLVVVCAVLGPLFGLAVHVLDDGVGTSTLMTASDLAVAVYLRGDIALPAVQFAELLETRSRILDMLLAGDLPWATALLGIVVLGTLAMTVRASLTVLHIRTVLSDSYVWRRTRTTDFRLSDTATVPFAVRGLIRRHIVLPSGLVLRPAEMRIVVAHEIEHLRQGDVEWEIVVECLRPLLFWNPVFLLWTRAFSRLRELGCDRAVLDRLSVSPNEYAECLLRFCAIAPGRDRIERFNVGLVRSRARGARAAFENRLLALTIIRNADGGRYVLALAACIMVCGVLVASALVRDPGDWSHDRLMLSTIVNLERMEAYGF